MENLNKVKLVIWSPHATQKKVSDSKARFKVVVAGRRWGKTLYAVSTLTKQALLKANTTFFYIAPYYKQAKMIAWKLLSDKARDLPPELVSKINESELSVKFTNGSTIAIKGADNPDGLRGVGLDGVVLDEFADMRPSVWEEIIRPSLADRKGWAIFIGTPKGFNIFYELYNDAQSRLDWEAFRFTTYDNPIIDPLEIDSAKREMSDDKFNQEFMADFRKYEGAVYKEFDRTKHLYKDKQINKKEEIAGVDWGFTNPTAMLRVYVDNDDNYFIDDEYYQPGKTTEEIISYLRTWKPEYVYPDPAEPDRNRMLTTSGFYVRDVNKDIVAGIDKVRELFKHNKIFINERCTNLIRELEMYHYDDTNLKELPVKELDHLCDTLRYILFMHSPKRKDFYEEVFEVESPLYGDIGL